MKPISLKEDSIAWRLIVTTFQMAKDQNLGIAKEWLTGQIKDLKLWEVCAIRDEFYRQLKLCKFVKVK